MQGGEKAFLLRKEKYKRLPSSAGLLFMSESPLRIVVPSPDLTGLTGARTPLVSRSCPAPT